MIHQNVIFHKPTPILMCITLGQIAVLISHLTRSVPQWWSSWRQTKLTWRATDTRWECSHKSAEVHVRRCMVVIYILRPRQNGRHFPDDILKWILFTENLWISIKLSLKIVPSGSINSIPALVQIIHWLNQCSLVHSIYASLGLNELIWRWLIAALHTGVSFLIESILNYGINRWLHITQLYRMLLFIYAPIAYVNR